MKKILFSSMLALSTLVAVQAQVDIDELPEQELPLRLVFPDPAEGEGSEFGWTAAPQGPLAGKVDISLAESSITLTANGWPQYQALNYTLNDGLASQVRVNLAKGGYIVAKAKAVPDALLRFDFLSNVGDPTVPSPQYRSANVGSIGKKISADAAWVVYPKQSDWTQNYSLAGKFDPAKDGHVDSSRISHLNINLEDPIAPASYTGVVTIDTIIISDEPIQITTGLASALDASTKLYPNPANGEGAFVDYLLNSSAKVKFVIYDMTGRAVAQSAESVKGAGFVSHEALPVSSLEQGVYNVSFIVDGAIVKSERLVIK